MESKNDEYHHNYYIIHPESVCESGTYEYVYGCVYPSANTVYYIIGIFILCIVG